MDRVEIFGTVHSRCVVVSVYFVLRFKRFMLAICVDVGWRALKIVCFAYMGYVTYVSMSIIFYTLNISSPNLSQDYHTYSGELLWCWHRLIDPCLLLNQSPATYLF